MELCVLSDCLDLDGRLGVVGKSGRKSSVYWVSGIITAPKLVTEPETEFIYSIWVFITNLGSSSKLTSVSYLFSVIINPPSTSSI